MLVGRFRICRTVRMIKSRLLLNLVSADDSWNSSNTIRRPYRPQLCAPSETIVTGDDLQTQVVIASGALQALLALLSSPKDGIRKEACWTISNVTAGSPHQIQAVIDANIIPPLINILQNADFKTRKEACWAISNATSGGLQEPSQIRYLVSQGCIKPLCDLLQTMDNRSSKSLWMGWTTF